jgi:NADPH-dependent 7-cyano-7-deazaguanine reductase QueF
MRIETVDVVAAGVRVEVTSPISHRCPFQDETDKGTITIGWRIDGRTLEMHALRDYLRRWADQKVSHEELIWTVQRDVSASGVTPIHVTSTWTTAGMTVMVSTTARETR